VRKLLMTTRSPFARKVRVALRLKELDCEDVEVALGDAKPRALLASGPSQKVPVLLDGGLTIADSTVICEYLEERYPQTPLYPTGYLARADTRMWEQLADEACDAAIRIFMDRQRPGGPPDLRALERAQASIGRILDYAEDTLRTREYLVARQLTIADIALGAALGYIAFRLGEEWFAKRPSVQAYHARLAVLPAFQATRPA
jgi:glutathione S-transferase